MSALPEFVGFPKIARISREIVVTEKIDGTNACVYIPEVEGEFACGNCARHPEDRDFCECAKFQSPTEIFAASRNRWITPEDDNLGFAGWLARNKDELLKLGPGRHYGEWWGQGIQRRYGLKEKRFSLFNVARWGPIGLQDGSILPSCCHVVPVLGRGLFKMSLVEEALEDLRQHGSRAAPGYMDPEGVVVYHTAGRVMFKKTLKGDEKGKGE